MDITHELDNTVRSQRTKTEYIHTESDSEGTYN